MSKTLKYNKSVIRFGDLQDSNFDGTLQEKYAESKKVIITDENVYDLWMETMISNYSSLSDAEIIQLPAGEENKVLDICNHVWLALSEYEVGRNDLIINIGGGVITDMGGFIASTFKRGLSFINVPTTLLSQVDASIGGKTGIDLGPYKNQIGVFADPEYVFIDTAFLSTLPEEELCSGFAEMLKHGLIADKDYWEELKLIDPKNTEKLISFIQKSIEIKKNIVEKDHKESGPRKILNFGHTVGHALEGFFLQNETPIPHGFAVAWGMITEAWISFKLNNITQVEFTDIEHFLEKVYPKPDLNKSDIPAIHEMMRNDKKSKSGMIKFSLLEKVGKANYDNDVSHELIEEAIRVLI